MNEQLTRIINDVLEDSGRPPCSQIEPEMRLREDLGFDSLDLAVLAVQIESAIGVDVFAIGLPLTVEELRSRFEQKT
jgi:acyl carrier protein